MVKIRLNPTAFAPGGPLEKQDPARVVFMIGTGKKEQASGVLYPPVNPDASNWIDPQFALPVTMTGVEISDITLQLYNSNPLLQTAYGQQILDLLARGLILVEHNGVALTPAQVLVFVA